MRKCLVSMVFALSALVMLNGCIVSEKKLTDKVQEAMIEYEQNKGNRLEVTDLKLEESADKGYKGVLTGKLNGEDVIYDVTVSDAGDDLDVDWKLRKEPEALQQEAAPELTYANMVGIYDSFNEDGGNESRIGLQEDGTAIWNMIGSLNYTEFKYTIKGNTICLSPIGVDSEEDCYEYDPETRSLKNEQGAIYYRQTEE